MDTDLKCNRLSCRKTLIDKAVVTTCSHIFCVECANELFNASRLCPACETSLTEPDDVVVCSLRPSNDYKTSVLSGLSPSIILEICSRALSFWQYQIHQENSFQQAVTRNLSDKNAQLQKQLDNVIREANGELNLLGNKVSDLERDLELERRRVHELQDASREREKEYQKLKAQHDRAKRRALLASDPARAAGSGPNLLSRASLDHLAMIRPGHGDIDIGAVVGGMEAHRIQRTPIGNRTMTASFGMHQSRPLSNEPLGQVPVRSGFQRQLLNSGERSFRADTVSDRSESANEVENMLLPQSVRVRNSGLAFGSSGWGTGSSRSNPVQQRTFNPQTRRDFRPAR
ncbi:hypothetical protein F5I97DRAFT_2057980 [Phlebopus sp. FC_14]|nr:hypothetical protein F5I97DRAFT_2057980 [Phlebopus sp. FC_14]